MNLDTSAFPNDPELHHTIFIMVQALHTMKLLPKGQVSITRTSEDEDNPGFKTVTYTIVALDFNFKDQHIRKWPLP